jgi:hypothetical protein
MMNKYAHQILIGFVLSLIALSVLAGCASEGVAGGNPPVEFNKNWTEKQKAAKAKRDKEPGM